MAGGDTSNPMDESPPEVAEKTASDSIGKELSAIRLRRTTTAKRRFPSAIEDYTLLSGMGYGVVYFLLLFGMSAGVLGNSTALDAWASDTFLDIGDPCIETENDPWILIYPDNDALKFNMRGKNLESGFARINWTASSDGGFEISDGEDKRTTIADFEEWPTGEYDLRVAVSVFEFNNFSADSLIIQVNKTVSFEISESSPALGFLPFVDDDPQKEARMTETGPRTCWSTVDLGRWGWALMGAELGGGRETAMLTGGAAGIPAWWMAFISLSLSVVSLFLAYPVMYKVYHQDTDDMLSRKHIVRVVEEVLRSESAKFEIDVDWELYKIEVRELSIDIMVPYHNTDATLADQNEIRTELLREILEEFAIFRVFKPVQLTVKTIGENQAIDFESGIGIGTGMDSEGSGEVEDYTTFFRDLHLHARLEDDVRDSLKTFFRDREDLHLKMATVTIDEHVVFVPVIYRPTQRLLAWLRFKERSSDIESMLKEHIVSEIGDLLQDKELIVKARNQISTLSDRAGAGRVERMGSNDERVAAVARQDGFGGRVLQTKLLGDILSTVEYTANEKRDLINKWGFWGLIVFVWIPFMASGVLVGAMLGLLSRMKFMRVLWATFIGGAAASITWAYTAEGIVSVMHKYKLEAAIPLAIIAFILMAFLHMRSTKNRRQAELFEDTMLDSFHADIHQKYGD